MSDNYSIFKPKSGRGLFFDYPELKKVEAFRKLNPNEMLFVWLFACESSPYYEVVKDRDRAEKSINSSFLKNGKKLISDKDRDRFLAGEFGAKITVAIEEMSKFKVSPRAQGLEMLQHGFDNLQKILKVEGADGWNQFYDKDGNPDFSKKKAYVDTLKSATELTPKLIEQLEGRFSLNKDTGEGNATFEGENLLDDYHERTT